MNPVSIIGFFLSIVGIFGALRFSSIFFGIFMVGLFLLIYSILPKKNKMPPSNSMSYPLTESSIQTPTSPSRFCYKCGAELHEQHEFCPLCGVKVRK